MERRRRTRRVEGEVGQVGQERDGKSLLHSTTLCIKGLGTHKGIQEWVVLCTQWMAQTDTQKHQEEMVGSGRQRRRAGGTGERLVER